MKRPVCQVTLFVRLHAVPKRNRRQYLVRGNAEYRGTLSAAEIDELRRKNVPFYHITSQNLYNLDITGVVLETAGCQRD